MNVIFICLFVFSLIGCATYPEKSTLINIMVQERYDAQEICTQLIGWNTLECALVGENPCRIIINPFRVNDNPEALGHEVLHCLNGPWHVNWKIQDTLKGKGANW